MERAWGILDSHANRHTDAAGNALLLRLVQPLLADAEARVSRAIAELTAGIGVPLVDGAALGHLVESLADRLLTLILKSTTLELTIARVNGGLAGHTPEERFANFASRFSSPSGRKAFFSEYPVLLRLCAQCCEDWVEAVREMVIRLEQDWGQLRSELHVEGWVTGAQVAGDPHNRGRQVITLAFANGGHVVYKPKPLRVARQFQELLGWLNRKGLQPPQALLYVIDKGTYGWCEFVKHSPECTPEQVQEFYKRLGALLCILAATRATDAHFENIIAVGPNPYLVDLETLFLPQLVGAPSAKENAFSLLNVGLLPSPVLVGEELLDLSGMGARPHQGTVLQTWAIEDAGTDQMRVAKVQYELGELRHLPWWNGEFQQAANYVEEVVSGYGAAYSILVDNKLELLSEDGPLARFRNCEVRILIRPTATYSALLQESVHPNALRNALDNDLVLAQLWRVCAGDPLRRHTVRDEYRQLQSGDIPYFRCMACSTDLAGYERMIPGVINRSGFDCVQASISAVSYQQLQLHGWIVRGSFAGLTPPEGPDRRWAVRAPMPAYEAAYGWLDSHKVDQDGSLTWLTLSPADENARSFTIHKCGFDLYEGLAGITLFLFALARHTGNPEHLHVADLALDALGRAQTDSGELPSGAFDGLAGVLFTYSLVADWHPQYRDQLEAPAASLHASIARTFDKNPAGDLVSGLSGVLLCVLEYQRCWSSLEAAGCAGKIGSVIQERIAGGRTNPAAALQLPYDRGMSHGLAGVSLALYTLGARTGEVRFIDEALFLSSIEREAVMKDGWTASSDSIHAGQNTWCHGATGITCARLAMQIEAANPVISSDLSWCLEVAANSPAMDNDSLCHGTYGNLEPLILAASALPDESRWRDAVAGRCDELRILQEGASLASARPAGFPTPGFMTGLSGIGYSALRASSPDLFPSVLTLGAGALGHGRG